MKNRKLSLIIIGVLILVGVISSFLFTIKEVPDIKINPIDDFENDDAGGLNIYHEVIKSYFDDLDVVLITSLDEIQDTNALFITVTKQSGFNKIKLDSLTNLISIGNDVMFVGEYLPYQFEVDFGDIICFYSAAVLDDPGYWSNDIKDRENPPRIEGFFYLKNTIPPEDPNQLMLF